jgi:hypothetical protein
MRHRFINLGLLSFIATLVIWGGCTDKSPTGPGEATRADLVTPSGSSTASLVDPQSFSCDDVQEVRVRFSSPGFVNGNEVAVYAAFIGAPPGDKFLRIWWDYQNNRETFQIVDTQAGEPQRDNDDLYDIETLVEHSYDAPRTPTDYTVRVELILEGGTRGCARNRDITVTPLPPSCTSDADCGGAVGSCSAGVCLSQLTRWSAGTNSWPDEACNPTNSFGSCNTNAQDHADAWATEVCQANGWSSGTWTGNKMPGCAGDISMYCQGAIPCNPRVETTCAPGDQTQVEFTCQR